MQALPASTLVEAAALVLVSFTLGVAALVLLRYIGKFPTEFDRVGSDLNLYGYGIALSMLFAFEAGRPVLRTFRNEWIPMITSSAALLTLLFYGFNLHLSKLLRSIEPLKYAEGLETWEHVDEVLSTPKGKKMVFISLLIGLLPSITMVSLDLFAG